MGKKPEFLDDGNFSNMNSLDELLLSKDQHEKITNELNQAKEANARLSEDLTTLKLKFEMLTKEIDQKSAELGKLKLSMEKDKELRDNLEKQLDHLKKQYEDLVEESKQLKRTVQAKDDAINAKDAAIATKDKQVIDKDEQIKQLDAKIHEISSKIEEGSGKASTLQDTILGLQKENEALRLKEKDLHGKISDAEEKYEKLKLRFRDSGDSVLGTTMELEKIKTELLKRDEEITVLKGKLGSILTGGSGIITTKEHLLTIFKEKVAGAHRSIRLCIPSLSLLDESGMLSILQQFPKNVVVNIAGDIKATDEHIILDLKPRGMTFTQYDQKDRWVLNRDGEDTILALEKNDGTIVGFFSNEPKIVTMLNSAINEPWVRGIKI